MAGRRTELVASLLAVVAGFVVVAALSSQMTAAKPSLPEGFEDEDLIISAARLKGVTPGFDGLIADWYWMRSLQYIGDKLLRAKEDMRIDDLGDANPRLLYPLLDSATDLDPHFLAPYTYGAMVLPTLNPQEAVALLEKGIANNPSQWRLYQHLGFIHWKLGEFERAAEMYDRGSAVEGAAPFMKLMAARMRTEGGSRETARAIYEDIYNSTENRDVMKLAELRLLQLKALDEIDLIQQALGSRTTGGCQGTTAWRDLGAALRTLRTKDGRPLRFEASSGAPIDPVGVPYLLGADCSVKIDDKRSTIPTR